MLAPVPPKRTDGGSSFGTLGRYLTSTVDQDTGEVLERGDVMLSDNLISAQTASAEMRAVADENARCKDPVLHVVLSWKEGEQPSREQWQEAVRHTMDSLRDRDGRSMADHQFMAVAHDDTENFHVHIMANRVHPETYKANSPEWLHKSLDKACREIEAAQGWEHGNGLYRWDEEKGQAVAMTREERAALKELNEERALERGTAGTGRANKMETYGNAESLETYAKGAPAKDLSALMKRDGINWQDVHSTLERHGLKLHKGDKGGYTVSAEGAAEGERIHVKASKVFRKHFAGKAERAALEAKLGDWQEPKEFIQHVTERKQEYRPTREPKRNAQERDERREERAEQRADLKARYRAYKAEHSQGRAVRQKAQATAQAELRQQLNAELKARREAIRSNDNLAPEVRKAMLSVAAAEAVQKREALRLDLAARRRAAREQDKPQGYRAWVEEKAKEGDGAAISQLRGWQYQDKRAARELERRGEQIDQRDSAKASGGGRHDPADPRSFADEKKSVALRMTWQVDTRTGDVDYQIDGKQSFTDHGERVSFGDGKDKDAIEAGLRLAAAKWKEPVELNGSDEFKRRAVQVAAERGVPVKFADKELAVYHEACKHQAQVEREREAARARGVRESREDRDYTPGM